MAATQVKQGRKGAGSDFVGDIRIMGSSPAAAASLSPIGRGIAEMSLQLLPVLQTTLDIHQLIGLFHGHAKQVIHHDSVLYRHPKDGVGVSIGEPGRHSCTYRLVVEGAALGEIAFSRSQSFSAPEISLLECLVCALVYPLRNGLSYKAAMEEARRDSLTGVYNRGVMEAALEREVGLAHRYRSPLSLIFMDIDYFKSINDTYGHTVGDEAIREFARCVNEKIRATDILSRYGGDEFVAILPNTTLEGADLLANRIREGMMQSRGFAEMARGMRITASIGIASLEGGEMAQHLLDRADRLLNLAKQAGRDCVRRTS